MNILPERSVSSVSRGNTSYSMNLEQVASFFNTKIKAVLQLTGLARSTVFLLNVQFRWNIHRLTRVYHDVNDNSTELLKSAGLFTVLLASNEQKLKNTGVTCSVCRGKALRLQSKTLPNCLHVLCPDCYVGALLDRLILRKSATSSVLKCPVTVAPGIACDNEVEDELLTKLFKDERDCQTFIRKSVNDFVQTNTLMKWCPSPKGCANAILLEQTAEIASVRCECGYAFCFTCLKPPHEPTPCRLVSAYLRKPLTKPCPSCGLETHEPVSKAVRFVTCKNQDCKYQFCWDCLALWRTHASVAKHCLATRAARMREQALQKRRARSVAAAERLESSKQQEQDQDQDQEQKQEQSLNRISKHSEFCYSRFKANSHAHDLEKDAFTKVKMKTLQDFVKELAIFRKAIMNSFILANYLNAERQAGIFMSHVAGLETAANSLSAILKENISVRNVPIPKMEMMTQQVAFARACMRRLMEYAIAMQGSEVDWYLARQKTLQEQAKC